MNGTWRLAAREREMRQILKAAALSVAMLMLSACASMPSRDPLQVSVAGIESLPGEGMELRLLVKLRVQNPNDTPIEFNGVSLNLDVLGRDFASGVSDQAGTVPHDSYPHSFSGRLLHSG
jgi:LEA14-like dessication related protein